MSPRDYTAIYDPDEDFDARYTLATGRSIARWLRPDESVLELGCATGLMTTLLAGDGRRVTAVDRSAGYLARAAGRPLDGCEFLAGDLDALPHLGRFHHVVLTNVLHEVADPAAVLRRVAEAHVVPGALVHVSLQNPRSLHRLVALEMGLIDDLHAIADRGRRYGTRRLLDADGIADLGAGAGLHEIAREGVFLKPLPNDTLAGLPAPVLDGLERAARHLPEHGALNLLTFRAG
jgi:SAM-dependent methyltransferase